MTTKKRNLLRLKSLQFVSLVDQPANEHSTFVVKRAAGSEDVSATCRIVKIDETLGLLIGFANASTVAGEGWTDLQGDVTSEDELVKVCLEYAEAGAPVDEMHDEQQVDGAKTVFLFPLTADLAKSLDLGEVNKTGILFGVKVPPAVIARAKMGEINGFSIGGMGTREPLEKSVDRLAVEKAKHAAQVEALAKLAAENEAIAVAMMKDNDETLVKWGRDIALHVAKGNTSSIGKWGERWLAAHPEVLEPPSVVVEKKAETETLESIMKSLDVTYEKAHSDWNAELAKYEKANPGRNITHFIKTDAGRAAYMVCEKARSARIDGPVERYTKAHNADLEQLQAQIEKEVEAFGVMHNLESHEARVRLSKVSPSFRALVEKQSETREQRDRQAVKARADVQRFRHDEALRLEKARDAEIAKRNEEQRLRHMTPAARRLEALAQKRAAETGETVSKAMTELVRTDVGRELYATAQEERAERQMGRN